MKSRFLIAALLCTLFVVYGMNHAHASCSAPLFGAPGPCFDSFMISHERITEEYIMNHIYEYIDRKYDRWQMSDREWSDEDIVLDLPAIICTEFVTEGGQTEYRMLKWADLHRISYLENHRDDFLCNKWLPPISNDLPACDPNPKYGFEECQKNYDVSSNSALQAVLNHCQAQQRGGWVTTIGLEWGNATHYIDNRDCEFLDNTKGSQTYGLPFDDSSNIAAKAEPKQILEPIPSNPEFTEENSFTASYVNQWILKIILIVVIIAGVASGVIIGIKVWGRKRK